MTNTPHSKSQAIPLVKREDVKYFVGLLGEYHEDFYSLLRQAQIPNDLFNPNSQYEYLPETTLKNLIQILGSRMKIDDFARLISDSCRLIYVPKFVSLLTTDESLQATLNEFSQLLKSTSSNALVYTQEAGEKVWLVRDKEEADEIWFKYGEMFAVTFLCELLTTLTQGAWLPEEIGVRTESAYEFSRLPGLESTQFYCSRPTTAIHIPDDILSQPVFLKQTSNESTIPYEILPGNFLDTFKLAIQPYVSMGKLPIKIASEILNINVRTIQRRLKEHNVIYSQVIEEMVFNQIIQLLKCDQLPITEVASKMGYSDSAHFTRAFKRLMHMTPREYRSKFKNRIR
ncbi:AraC family transcriptional regulator [Vibrio makurazakiensis]|uniref:helix-turn-helix domain-containing protein n=1 Tax=Vibrio makurazakiensis TaxID=2910250 RepID=UPI003D1351CB